MRAYSTRSFGKCLLHVHTYMHLAVHHQGTHGWHVPTITMDTTICTLSYRKIKVVGSQAFARFQVPSSLPVRYTFEPFVSRGRRFLDQYRVCTCTHTQERKKRDKSGFLISMLRSETMLIDCTNGEVKKNDDVEDDAFL